MSDIDFDLAILDPTSVFDHPDDVLSCNDLNTKQKKEILERWEYDARELQVAEDENMGGGDPSLLRSVLRALDKLGADSD